MTATLSLQSQCFAVSELPIMPNLCSSTLRDDAQQNCVTVAVSSSLVKAQQERQVWVTSLHSSTLGNAADDNS